MRTTGNKQMLTTGRIDSNGNQVRPEVIDWSEFDKNPVLLYNPETEGHGGVVVGKVIDRERLGPGFAGRLVFLDDVAAADIAWEKYSQGFLPYVSVGGLAAGRRDPESGVFIAEQYLIKEVSLVKIPANLDARVIEVKQVDSSDSWFTDNRSAEEEVCVIEMAFEAQIVEEPIEAAAQTTEEPVTEEPIEAAVQATEEPVTEEPIEAAVQATEEPVTEEPIKAAVQATEEPVTEEPIEAAAQIAEEPVTEEPIEAAAKTSERPLPAGMSWHEQTFLNKTKQNMTNKTYQELNCDADFQKRMQVLNSAFRTNASCADATPENKETVQLLASAMLQDEKMVILASATNFTNGITKERTNGLKFLVECAAGGAAAATLAAADLGVIKWLSLFYEKLLPNNTFMRSLRFVPMSDREGAIYVESGINPATYIGATTPVNAPRYVYDDIKRTVARQVFSIQPVLFQNADMAVLAYDKQSLGWKTAMDSLMSDVCTFILQTAANTPGIAKVATTGEVFESENAFPLEAPSSNVQVKGMNYKDVIFAGNKFLTQNYRLTDRLVEIVVPPALFSRFAASDEMISLLTKDLSGNARGEITFMGNRITPRSVIAAVDTADGSVVLDESLYADGKVASDTGNITSVDPAVTGATHVGAGVAFVENEIIAGIGTIDVIIMPDPTNYGVTMSGWMSAGATVAREDGKGVALIVPSVAE